MKKFTKVTARGEGFRLTRQTEKIPPWEPLIIHKNKACLHAISKMILTGKLYPPTLFQTEIVEHKLIQGKVLFQQFASILHPIYGELIREAQDFLRTANNILYIPADKLA
jgi:hypothetical protein